MKEACIKWQKEISSDLPDGERVLIDTGGGFEFATFKSGDISNPHCLTRGFYSDKILEKIEFKHWITLKDLRESFEE